MCGEARRRPVSSRGGKPEGSLLAGPAEGRARRRCRGCRFHVVWCMIEGRGGGVGREARVSAEAGVGEAV